MGPTHGSYILQLCMGPSYFWRGLTPPDPPLFRTLAVRDSRCDCTVMPLSTYGSLHQSSTSRPDKDFGLPPRTICRFLPSDCLLLDLGRRAFSVAAWRSCLERCSCRRHFSTFSVHFPKTFKSASFSTLLSWPCPVSHFFSLCGPCGSCLLLSPPTDLNVRCRCRQ